MSDPEVVTDISVHAPEPGLSDAALTFAELAMSGAMERAIREATVQVVVLPHAEDLPLPAYATEGSAGMDLLAAVGEPVWIRPGETEAIPTGLRLALPWGHELQIRSRSGLARDQGVVVAQGVGTVDEDYRGEVLVLLRNTGRNSFEVTRGMRIAQAVLAPVSRAVWQAVAELPETDRGEGGFGHTGLAAPEAATA